MTEKKSTILSAPHLKQRFKVSFPTLVGLFVAAIGIIAAAFFSDYVTTRSRQDFDSYTNQQTATITSHLQSDVRDYQQLLLGAAAMFNTKQSEVTADDWREYVASTRATIDNPALLGIGYSQVIDPADLATHEQAMCDAGHNDCAVRPAAERDIYTSIVFLQPEIDVNKKAVGYDMFSDPTRQKAMARARDNATFGLSEPVKLVQDEGSSSPARGVLMYYPVYHFPAVHPSSVDERRQTIAGYVYVVFRPSDIMQAIDTNTLNLGTLDYTLRDGGSVLDTHTHTRTVSETPTERQQSIELAGRVWTVSVVAYQPSILSHTSPAGLFLLGTIASMAVGGLVTFALQRRVRRLYEQQQSEVQRTKNELVALASHQLRTPATGVKQYVGLLRDGFVGELDDRQQAIVEKAYIANERQLDTIEQLLYVAKADAGQLLVNRQRTDLAKLTAEIVDEMNHSADLQGRTVETKFQTNCHAAIDRRFVRMAIENLISNAAKYSPTSSTIYVTVQRSRDEVTIAVRDEGVGIAEQDQDKLFQKFSRIQNSMSQSVDGSGLGLFLVEKIMSAHDGNVTVDSAEGQGSTFRLHFARVVHNKKGESPHDKK